MRLTAAASGDPERAVPISAESSSHLDMAVREREILEHAIHAVSEQAAASATVDAGRRAPTGSASHQEEQGLGGMAR
jgi:hypothetical protein